MMRARRNGLKDDGEPYDPAYELRQIYAGKLGLYQHYLEKL
jgi:hypothetical protein